MLSDLAADFALVIVVQQCGSALLAGGTSAVKPAAVPAKAGDSAAEAQKWIDAWKQQARS